MATNSFETAVDELLSSNLARVTRLQILAERVMDSLGNRVVNGIESTGVHHCIVESKMENVRLQRNTGKNGHDYMLTVAPQNLSDGRFITAFTDYGDTLIRVPAPSNAQKEQHELISLDVEARLLCLLSIAATVEKPEA